MKISTITTLIIITFLLWGYKTIAQPNPYTEYVYTQYQNNTDINKRNEEQTYKAVFLNEENDALALHGGSDDQYTQGLQIGYQQNNQVFFIQQNIYTPNNIRETKNQPDDRPYLGILLLGYSVYTEPYIKDDFLTFTKYSIHLGTSGEYSYAKETQNEFHEFIGNDIALGWNNQINTEPIINLSIQQYAKYQAHEYLQLYGKIGADAGNLITRTYIQTGLKIGIPEEQLPWLETINVKSSQDPIFLFADIIGYATAHNMALDGSLFQNNLPSNTESIPFVYEYQAGLGIYIYDIYCLIGVATRSSEFKNTRTNKDSEDVDYGFIQFKFIL